VAQLAFARVRRHTAVGGDRNPGVELTAARAVEALRGHRGRIEADTVGEGGCAEADDQGAGSPDERPARQNGSLERVECV
jgi:hypothetical protein